MKLPLAGSYSTDQLTTFCARNFETAASKIQQTGSNTSQVFFLCPDLWSSCMLVLFLCVFRGFVGFCFFFLIVFKNNLLNKCSVPSSTFLLFLLSAQDVFHYCSCCAYCDIVCCVATVLFV